ncbi:uncharacterized protein LOC129591542 [Paramacrobiotus metropolitanus]|uniref:uncharacterized protein LOC129591542 n=1 Tax=Paramacrobiotus metropolitanus TaxID=2943436 RepID=UPI0024456F49|nr:uncharacterized protein LOC129591542 [Paramacrobiotus metropolitanus]XP_055343187.1 uncharacterized protein LOC129591542 [Paramacrobiotus metropolitanus]
MSESRPPVQYCEDESTLFGQHSRLFYTGLAALPWRTQLISGALPLNPHVRPLVLSLSGPRRTEMQSLLWPHIVHRYNVVYIENPLLAPEPPPNYDNAMDAGFVVPMLLRIAESCARRHLAQSYNEGPLAIVIVATLEESLSLVEEIRTAAMQFDRDFRVVNVFELPDEKEFQEKSYLTAENCDVLVVALHSVLTLFATQGRLWSAPINLMKVEIVVFRNIDVLLRINPTLTETILGRFRENPEINYVFAASASSPAMKKLVGKLENIVCTVIGNYLDAVVHEKLPIQLFETNAKFSLPWVMQAQKTFQDRQPGEKIILFVGSDRQSAELKQSLALQRSGRMPPKAEYDFQAVSENDSIYDVVNGIRDWWKSDPKEQIRILAIPDKYAGDFGIDDADLIVHLAPPQSVLQFLRRFGCVRKSFALWTSKYAALAKGNGEKVVMPSMPCRIVLDEGWKPILPIVLYMASAAEGYSIIPAPVVLASQKILQSPRFMQLPPCLIQLYYGDCIKKGSCSARHYHGRPQKLTLALSPDKCTKFEFRLMRYLNPMHFIARIVRVFVAGENTSIISYERLQKDLDEEMANILDELPQPYNSLPDPDVVCGMVSANGKKLHRVQVLKSIDKDHVHVYYVDEGIGMPFLTEDRRHPKLSARIKSSCKFYPLPEKVANMEKTWVNMIIARIQPSSQEVAWRPSTSAAVYTAIKGHIVDEKSLMETKSVLSTEDFVLVDNFKSFKIQEGRNVCVLSMQNILSRNSRFVANPTHLEKLSKSLENENPCRGQSLSTTLPLYVATTTDDLCETSLPAIQESQ